MRDKIIELRKIVSWIILNSLGSLFRLQDKEKFIFNIHGPISFLFCFVVLAVCGNRHLVFKTDRRSLVF